MNLKQRLRAAATALLTTSLLAATAAAQTVPVTASREESTVTSATEILNEALSTPGKGIPASMLRNAHGVVIVPNLIKAGFVIGGRHGRGVVLVKDTNGVWQAPQFLTMTGGSVGFQAGVAANDIILIFRSRRSIENLMTGKFTIGVDAAAAAGPVGRRVDVGTDARLTAELFSYSRSRGLFAGASIDGAVIQMDSAATNAFYASGTIPPSAAKLTTTLMQFSGASGAVVGTGNPAVARVQPQPQPGVQPRPGVQPIPMVNPRPSDNLLQRNELAKSWRSLQKLLDAKWQEYLALPAEVFGDGAQGPSTASLELTLARFDTVMQDPRYAVLHDRPEFQNTYNLLKTYLTSRTQVRASQLPLPSPPNATHTNRRY